MDNGHSAEKTNSAAKTKLDNKRRKKQRRYNLTTWLLVGMMLLGVAIIAYPTFSNWWNSFHATRVIANYSTTVERYSSEDLEAMREAAIQYNMRLLQKENIFVMSDEDMKEYNSLLNIDGNGIMGYIQIPSIHVDIPLYHGTEEKVLQEAIGHISWSSLPVGGDGTHTVVSGHRGLPRARLFSDLDKLNEGDRFTVTVLNQQASYEVDQIRIVEPTDLSELTIQPGKDYCTLVSCTPYGINTHRILVRGHRILDESSRLFVTPEAYRLPNYIAIPVVAVPLLFLLLMVSLVFIRPRPRVTRAMLDEIGKTELKTQSNGKRRR